MGKIKKEMKIPSRGKYIIKTREKHESVVPKTKDSSKLLRDKPLKTTLRELPLFGMPSNLVNKTVVWGCVFFLFRCLKKTDLLEQSS